MYGYAMGLARIASQIWSRLCPDVVIQRRIHQTLFSVSLRDHAFWIFTGDRADAESLPLPNSGHIWDLGSNIGLYSVKAAQNGCLVTAFDISLTNVLCLRQTAALNKLPIEVVHAPVTVERVHWTEALTGHTEESLRLGGSRESVTFLGAAEIYGIPEFIKFDIQGGEIEFLKSDSFRKYTKTESVSIWKPTTTPTISSGRSLSNLALSIGGFLEADFDRAASALLIGCFGRVSFGIP